MLSLLSPNLISTLPDRTYYGRGSFGWRGDGRDFSWKGSATLEGTAQQKGCRVCGKRPVLIQLYQYIYTDSYSSWCNKKLIFSIWFIKTMRWIRNRKGGYLNVPGFLQFVVAMVTEKRTRKPKSVTSSPKATAAPVERVPATNLEEAIRLRAYSIYEQRGREHGHNLDDWLIAEAEVVGKAFAQSA